MPTTGGVKRLLSGIRPNGALHLGHYVGALRQWVSYQGSHECYFMVADVQLLATRREPDPAMAANVRDIVLDWLAVGLDPERSHFVLQSRMPELAELTVYLQSLVRTGELRSNATAREEARAWGKGSYGDGASDVEFGFLGYPVAQAADILVFTTSPPDPGDELIVPVGFDQVVHVEFAAEVGRRFNERYGDVFLLPQPRTADVPRLPGIDGGSKMGKSLRNAILLKDPAQVVGTKIRGMFTDPLRVRSEDPGSCPTCEMRLTKRDLPGGQDGLRGLQGRPRDRDPDGARADPGTPRVLRPATGSRGRDPRAGDGARARAGRRDARAGARGDRPLLPRPHAEALLSMLDWSKLTVLIVGGAGQTGRELCRQLEARGVGTIVIHDLRADVAADAVTSLVGARGDDASTRYVASAGDLFAPAGLGTWTFVPCDGPFERVCRDVPLERGVVPDQRTDLLECLLDQRLGAFTPSIVKESLIWNLVRAYRPNLVIVTINTAPVLGYGADVIQSGRTIAGLARSVLGALAEAGEGPFPLKDLGVRMDRRVKDGADNLTADLASLLSTSLRMTALLDTAAMIRFVQCLHSLFCGGEGIRVPEFKRYVKVHTTGLGGMGFNIQYTHGDTGEPGLSTKLLGKVCATGSLTQLLLTLGHTPGCDVRVVVPATLVGFEDAPDAVIQGTMPRWTDDGVEFDRGPLPLVDTESLVPCDGSTTLLAALKGAAARVEDLGRPLEVPYLHSGENNPYAVEDIAAITSLGQMGSITKEEVARATLECAEGDSRYDVLAAIDAAILLPSHTASKARDRTLQRCRETCRTPEGYHLPSVSLGNLGPTTAKLLYEIEIIRVRYETVARVVEDATEMDMVLRACSYILEDPEGALLRRQILSLGIPIFVRRGPGQSGLLLGKRLLFPDPRDLKGLGRALDPDDPVVAKWLETGWIDLTGPRMRWWHERFREVHAALEEGQAVSRTWFDPGRPFSAGQFLGYLHSISGGERKGYM